MVARIAAAKVSATGTRSLELTKIILGLSLVTLLFGSGIWATLSSVSLSQNKDVWMSHNNR